MSTIQVDRPLQCFRGWLVLAVVLVAVGIQAADEAEQDPLAKYDAKIKPSDRAHWAFQPIRRQALPSVKNAAWVHNPIDAFMLTRLEVNGWQASPPAARSAWLRRTTFDLVGLPPAPDDVELLLADPSPDAEARIIDRLLASPRYGERWGRHWLDLVRYAETNGYERDAVKPSVWRYRDYVIHSFNADKPFDRFILEQLAGDEIPDATSDTFIATGYYRLGPWDDEPADPKEDRFDQLDDMVNTTSQAFLGLTLGCARCHNHKFEPLTQLDYYRMVAVFDPLERPRNGRTELDVPAAPPGGLTKATDARLAAVGYRPVLAGTASPLADAIFLAALAESRTPSVDGRAYVMREPSPLPPTTHLLLRGQAARPGPAVPPGVPAVVVARQPELLAASRFTTRRRLGLARWIASPDNPLSARVIVNRIWQGHFGTGLVRTSSDFGVMGEAPSHPELLDWLAGWFIEQGWSIKQLHRLILTSATYRQSSKEERGLGNGEQVRDVPHSPFPGPSSADPDNRLLWRFPYRRLEAEAIRDAMLAVSGQLRQHMYGPSMQPHVPKEALEGSSDPDKIWKNSDESDAARRTVYAHIKRSMVVPLLEVLDLCDTTRTAAKRTVTTVAPQALTLLNSEFTNQQARHFAERLRREAGPELDRQIDRAYRLALSRLPTRAERASVAAFCEAESESALRTAPSLGPASARRHALVQMCRVIFNLNEFVYPD